MNILQAFADIAAAIFLFGSQAQGTAHERSDYDIGYWTEAKIFAGICLEDRNLTFHTYDPVIADKVYESAKRLPEEGRKVLKVLTKGK